MPLFAEMITAKAGASRLELVENIAPQNIKEKYQGDPDVVGCRYFQGIDGRVDFDSRKYVTPRYFFEDKGSVKTKEEIGDGNTLGTRMRMMVSERAFVVGNVYHVMQDKDQVI